jgi:YD repeat-containing protein
MLCLGCLDRADGVPGDDRADSGAQETFANGGDSGQAPAKKSGRLDAAWHEQQALPDVDLSDCEVTSDRQDWTGKSPHTFEYAYEVATRTLKDPTYHTVFDDEGRAVDLSFRGDPRSEPTHFITMTYDERGQPSSSEHYTSGTTHFENGYDERGRLISVVVTTASAGTWRNTYRYEDALNPELWSLWERDIGMDASIDFTVERKVARDRQTFTGTQSGQARWAAEHFYRDGRIVRLESYGGGWSVVVPGMPNGQATWEWDDTGTLLSFHSDGSWGSDILSPTGYAYTETFTSGCRELARRFPWLFHLPGPDSTTLRHRADDP